MRSGHVVNKGLTLMLIALCAHRTRGATLTVADYNVTTLGAMPNGGGSIASSSNGNWLAWTNPDGSASLLDVGAGTTSTISVPNYYVDPAAISANGEVVGNVNDSGNNTTSLPFSYQSGVTTVLSSLVGQESAGYATGVNNAGTIVGNLRTNNTPEAFALSSSGQLTLLGGINVDASGINNTGTIVGSANFSGDSDGPVAASTWAVGSYALPPTNLGAGIGTLGQFINDSGDIAGTNPDGFQTNPFIEHDGQPLPLDVSPFNK